MVKSKRLNPSSVETKRTKTNPRKERKAERGDGKWIGAAREQSIERKREGRLGRWPQRQGERKVNGEFNLVWQPPFPLGRKKRNE